MQHHPSYTPLHDALNTILYARLTGERQNALALLAEAFRRRFSPGEFRCGVRKGWPEPLTQRSFGQEVVDDKLAEGLATYRETGNADDLAEWTQRHLDGIPKE